MRCTSGYRNRTQIAVKDMLSEFEIALGTVRGLAARIQRCGEGNCLEHSAVLWDGSLKALVEDVSRVVNSCARYRGAWLMVWSPTHAQGILKIWQWYASEDSPYGKTTSIFPSC